MAGHAWWYAVNYEADVQNALDALRQREFEAGRYFPAMEQPPFPVFPHSPAPGPQHSSIEEAVEEAEETGTRSILDFEELAASDDDWGLKPYPPAELQAILGTRRPTLAEVETELSSLLEPVGRGEGFYLTTFENGEAAGLFFLGYSFD